MSRICGFRDVCHPNPLLMVRRPKLYIRKHCVTHKLVKKITNTRHGITILHLHLIELRVILLIQVLEDMFWFVFWNSKVNGTCFWI